MNKIYRVIIVALIPGIVVLLLGIYIKLPDYLITPIYVILFGILSFLMDDRKPSKFLLENRKEKIIACGLIGGISLVLDIFLNKSIVMNATVLMFLQVSMSLVCSICIMIIVCIVITRKKI